MFSTAVLIVDTEKSEQVLKIPTGGRLSSWLFAKRGGVESGTTKHKSI